MGTVGQAIVFRGLPAGRKAGYASLPRGYSTLCRQATINDSLRYQLRPGFVCGSGFSTLPYFGRPAQATKNDRLRHSFGNRGCPAISWTLH